MSALHFSAVAAILAALSLVNHLVYQNWSRKAGPSERRRLAGFARFWLILAAGGLALALSGLVVALATS